MADQSFPIGAGSKQFPIKLVDNGDGTYSISTSSEGGGGGGGPDRELDIAFFRAKNDFTGASVGDLISASRMIDVSGTTQTQIGDTKWRNESTQTDLAGAPATGDIEPAMGASGVTNAQLVAALNTQTNALLAALGLDTTIAAMSAKLPASLGSKTGALSMSVVLASDQVLPMVRGIYQTGNGTAISNGQSANVRVNGFGGLMANIWLAGDTVGDGLANTSVKLNFPPDGGSGHLPMHGIGGFNGTSWDRIRANVNGLWTQGNVANGVADAGNPVKVGGKFLATAPTLTDGQRGDMLLNSAGSAVTITQSSGTTITDSVSASSAKLTVNRDGTDVLPLTGTMLYDNAGGYARMRGNGNGLFVQGNVAAGGSSAGNPVLAGAEYVSSAPNYNTGQRASLQVNNRGNLKVGLFDPAGQAAMTTSGSNADDIVPASGPTIDTVSYSFMHDYTRNRYVRLRGSADGQQVDVAPQMKTAFIMAITATATAAIQLTTGTRRISIVARGADIRYKLGTTNAVVALNTIAAASKDPSILVLQGERVDVNVVGFTHISVIADNDSASKTGSADIAEM